MYIISICLSLTNYILWKKLKIVIIGLGHWGKNFFRIVNDIENYFELIAIVDSNNNALNNIGNSDLHAFGSIDELLKSDIEFDPQLLQLTHLHTMK